MDKLLPVVGVDFHDEVRAKLLYFSVVHLPSPNRNKRDLLICAIWAVPGTLATQLNTQSAQRW
jgi:hypothetical protein